MFELARDCTRWSVFCRSPDFSRLCTRVFDRQDKDNMNFDDFIQCCVMVRMLTDAFRKKDAQQSGMIQIHYEEVISTVVRHGCSELFLHPAPFLSVRIIVQPQRTA